MADGSLIEWTDATWNPVTGCTKITAGCDNCYAARFAERFTGEIHVQFTGTKHPVFAVRSRKAGLEWTEKCFRRCCKRKPGGPTARLFTVCWPQLKSTHRLNVTIVPPFILPPAVASLDRETNFGSGG